MRDLAIAYGNNRQAKKWVNKTIRFDDLKERLKVTIRTTESAEEYAKMSKAQRDAAKDHGGFVGGVLAGGRRKVDTVESRSMIALDGDRIDTNFLDNYETNAPYTSFLYTTHSHTPDNPSVRLIFPLTRDITAEEFVAVSWYLAQMLGVDFFDECSYQTNQLMYWSSSPQNGVFVFKEVEKDWLNPDDMDNIKLKDELISGVFFVKEESASYEVIIIANLNVKYDLIRKFVDEIALTRKAIIAVF